ncbi:MAG: sodium:proton exchanger, partial [Sphingomonadales bacterium]|nr:sodium:proton exchanger [Sphingomonadales bacterium]
INTPFGERAFSVLLFQDLSIVPLITIIAALSRAPVDPSVPPGWLMAIYTVGALVGLVAAGRYIIGPVLRLVGRVGEQELFIVVGLFTVFASAAVMEALHLSTALGAFVAGVMLADSPYRHEIEADIEPFRAILLGLFFIAVGMVLDTNAVMENPGLVVGMALALVATKILLIFGIGRLFGMETRPAFGLGLLLSQGGEFGFVLFAQAQAALLIEPRAASIFGAVVTLSMATTPFLLMIARRYEHVPAKGEKPEGPAAAPDSSAIIIGYGRFGQTVATMLKAQDVSVTLIDLKPSQIERTAEFGAKVYYGDGRRIDLLRIAGAEQARLILFCTDDQNLGPKELSPILGAFPQAAVLVRAFDRLQMIKLAPLDLTIAVREVYESAIYMGVEALKSLGVDSDRIQEIEHGYRENDNARLEAQTVTGDMHVRDDIFSREPVIVRREA